MIARKRSVKLSLPRIVQLVRPATHLLRAALTLIGCWLICADVKAQDTEGFVSGTFSRLITSSPTGTVVVQVRGTDGLHHFRLQERPGSDFDRAHGMRHFIGLERRTNSSGARSRASLSLHTPPNKGRSDGYLYFASSRRHNRLHAVWFSLSRDKRIESRLIISRVRRSSVPRLTLGCASTELDAAFLSARSTTTDVSPAILDGLPAPRALFSPQRTLTISTTADLEFARRYGRATQSYIDSVVAAANALYTTQVGITLSIAKSQIIRRGIPSSALFEAEDILNSFRRTARQIRPVAGVNHLFTGKRLGSETIGLAYIGTACRTLNGFNTSLSKAVNRALLPVIVAHEIAHNLGAVHESVPNSLMNPAPRTNTTTFTPTTLNLIQQYVTSSGSCIAPR